MPYFDFHMHPTLKSMFSSPEAKSSPWVDIDTGKINFMLQWCSDFSSILGSQCNLRQLIESDVNLVCVALLIPDPGMLDNKLLLKQAETRLSIYLNAERLKGIAGSNLVAYPDLVKEDLDVLLNQQQFGVGDKKVKIIKNKADYDQNSKDTLHVVFSVEGCHTLSPTLNSSEIKVQNVLDNLDDLRKDYPVLLLNITHIESFPFCNQAFGMQFVPADCFKPKGNKLSNDGVAIMKHCYEKGILIDLKHTSLGARRMMIEDVRNWPEFQGINQPLVCTHAGFAGLSYNDIPDYIMRFDQEDKSTNIRLGKPKKYSDDQEIAFNPSSINLYDEDILAILQTGGLIGLSLDKRILGYKEADPQASDLDELAFEEEYVSNQELPFFIFKNELGTKATDEFCITTKEVLDGGIVDPQLTNYHLKHFMAHVLHVFKVANDNGYSIEKAMKQICLGSDFDGLINPVYCCMTINEIGKFKKQLINSFPSFAEANSDKVALPASFKIGDFAEQLFFENGKNFVLDRLEKLKA